MQKQRGFTLLELLIAMAIIGVVGVVAAQSGMGSWSSKREGKNTFVSLVTEIETLKNHALTKNTTVRGVLTGSSSPYTFETYEAAAPTTNCSAAGIGTSIANKSIASGDKYEITGTAVTNICFNRDGSSSGGTFIISPIDTSSTLTTYTLTITISTGFIDVVES